MFRFIFPNIPFISIICLFMAACNSTPKEEKKPKEIYYYSNGQVRSEVELKNNQRNGLMKQYYEDGTLQSSSIWKNGKMDGEVKGYYPSGKLMLITHVKDGKKSGKEVRYYENSQIERSATVKDTLYVGEAKFYYENGSLKEKMIFNERGIDVYYIQYDEKGSETSSGILPEIRSQSDTCKLGEVHNIEINTGIPLQNKVQVIVGPIEEKNFQYQVKDTLAILESDNNVFHYSATPAKPGLNTISMLFKHDNRNGKDTISIDGYVYKYSFHVIP